ncbi:hypothetical protein D9M72_492500 [compost metagenome]
MQNRDLRICREHGHEVPVVNAAVLSLCFGTHKEHPLIGVEVSRFHQPRRNLLPLARRGELKPGEPFVPGMVPDSPLLEGQPQELLCGHVQGGGRGIDRLHIAL